MNHALIYSQPWMKVMFYVSRYFYGMIGLIDNSMLNCIKVLGCFKLVLTHSFENARKMESWIQI